MAVLGQSFEGSCKELVFVMAYLYNGQLLVMYHARMYVNKMV